MKNIDLSQLTIEKAHNALMAGDFTAEDLTRAYLDAIKEKNQDLNIYLEVFGDAIEQARSADKRIAEGEKDNMLLGIPCAIKDNILIKGYNVSAASRILSGYVAPYSATVIKKLQDKGVVFLGRVNMDEFAMGASTENSAFGVTKNPLNPMRVSGGSSGGSAAAVAASLAVFALGSDTGGSIRQPASFCGVVGFKPTYGAVSRHGLIAMSSSLDQIGPITKTVTDARIVFDAIQGADTYDATTQQINLSPESPKKKIGIVSHFLEMKGIQESVKKNFKESIERLKQKGYDIVELDMPFIKHALEVYYIICPAEVSSNMSRFDGVRFGAHSEGSNLLEDYMKTRGELLGKEVKRRIMIGTYVLSAGYYDAYYNKALLARDLIKKDFEKAFQSVDIFLTPTSPSVAFKIGEKSSDPLEMYLADVFTVTANIACIPAISIPSGTDEEGLPIGIQLSGKSGNDFTVFDIAKDLEL